MRNNKKFHTNIRTFILGLDKLDQSDLCTFKDIVFK